jgi:hypothetical protein
LREISKNHGYRKEELKRELFSSPTSHYWGPYSRIEDYELEVSMTAAALKLGILSFSY